MKLDARRLIVPLVAGVVLVATLQQTLGALRQSGSWRATPRGAPVRAEDPFSRIESLLAGNTVLPRDPAIRNPFAYGAARVAEPRERRPEPVKPVVPAEPPRPVLTSIVWDADPRATVRYNGRDYSVRENSLFAEFRVRSITRTLVTLERGGETIVLSFRPKGD